MDSDDRYSTYEAKARFSEVIRLVREGRTITVTYHGSPVAEIRPIHRPTGTEARMEWLRSRGLLSTAEPQASPRSPLLARSGALARFLEDRNG